MIVELKKPSDAYPDLTAGQPYLVIGVEADDLRILNDQGLPYLYPAELFDVIDAREPEDWIVEIGDDEERYAYPPALNTAGFFEDFFDANAEAVRTFWRVLNQRLAAAGAAA